jgi:predicted thioesterase
VGESAVLDVVVTPELTVHFEELGPVHPVYATYNMAKHFEEAGRKLLLRHLDADEDGLGHSLSVEHLAPSWVGDRLRIAARCVEVRGNRVTCECTATDADGRTVGRGGTVQVALPQHVLDRTLDPVAGRRPQGVPPVGPG